MTASETHSNHAAPDERRKRCPNCEGEASTKLLGAGRIHREAVYRERFVSERFVRKPAASELKDLTDFAHSDDVAILACSGCGVLIRDEPIAESIRTYEQDTYDQGLIDRLFPRYVQAFRDKQDPYRELLSKGSKVLEVGSHYGAFLEVATEWGWSAAGVDIGKDTSRYAKSKGYLVFERALEDCGFPRAVFDGVFVWNCFEQAPQPKPLLREIRRILKPGGLLVVRTPNAVFYDLCETLLKDSGLFDEHDGAEQFALLVMAYNNLLAFPYLYGYNSANLHQLVSGEGFFRCGQLNSEILTLPLPEVPAWVAEEQRSVSAGLQRMNAIAGIRSSGLLTGPWMELCYRAE